MTPRPAMSVDLRPKTCPRCGAPAEFYYLNEAEAAKQTPLCWGYDERDCPGWRAIEAERRRGSKQ